MYHGVSCDALHHPENPAWHNNYKLFRIEKAYYTESKQRMGVINDLDCDGFLQPEKLT